MSRNLPVLLVDLGKRYGGVEVRIRDIALALHGRHPYAVAVHRGSELEHRLQAEGLNVVAVPYGRGDPRVFTFLWRMVRSGGYRIVDAHNVQSQWWAWLVGLVSPGVRTVMTVHSPYRTEYRSLKGRLYEGVLRAGALTGVDFVAIASALSGYLRDIGVPSSRINLIPNALRPSDATGIRRPELFDTIGWPPDAFVVITVARLEPSKALDTLIEAVRLAAAREPRLRSLIVGDGRLRSALEAQVQSAGLQDRVHLSGFVRDVIPLLLHSHAFCLSSQVEGLPYALLEAVDCGLPVVVTRVGEIPRLLEHGRTGLLVPPGDPVALSEGLLWLAGHPSEAKAMRDAARAMVRDRFSYQGMIDSTFAFYGLAPARTAVTSPPQGNASPMVEGK